MYSINYFKRFLPKGTFLLANPIDSRSVSSLHWYRSIFFFFSLSLSLSTIRWMRDLCRESAGLTSGEIYSLETGGSDEPRDEYLVYLHYFPAGLWYGFPLNYAAAFMQINRNKFLTARPGDEWPPTYYDLRLINALTLSSLYEVLLWCVLCSFNFFFFVISLYCWFWLIGLVNLDQKLFLIFWINRICSS